ncbi:CC0125/CC1285 family lipoprotein [Shewanella atlantica]|uniref:Uncharacterized protein n=1 Tax=Shewanella atlantica TaxID=271099 RepID=A0A431VWQ4_9GAMM|nr:hypothetical protein [Shewanella atlantica]RTR27677.1 hypothetical protein EKG39_19925 [Shewanella atlantica]
MLYARRFAIAVLLTLYVSGCATSYDTKKSFWTFGKGFDVAQVDVNSWEIGFVGNINTDRALTRKYIIKKAAELVAQGGYPYFILENERVDTDEVSSTSSGYKDKHSISNFGSTFHETTTSVEVIGLMGNKNQKTKVYNAQYIIDHVHFDD